MPCHGVRRPRSCSAAVVLLLLARASVARADDTTVGLSYEAPGDCPSAEQFIDEVRARTPHAHIEIGADAPRRFGVVIVHSREGPLGRLVLQHGSATSSVREVPARTCAEVVSAMALSTALAIDPNASMERRAPPPPPAPPSERTPPESAPGEERAAPVVPPPGDASSHAPASAASSPWTAYGGLQGSLVGGLAPGPAVAGGLFAELSHGSSRWLAPSARISFEYARSTSIHTAVGTAQTRLVAASLDLCPVQVPIQKAIVVRPCARAEVGSLSARGEDVPNASEEARFWLAGGGLVRGELLLLDGWLLVTIHAGIRASANQERFFFRPDVTVLHVPALAGYGAVGLGARFF